MNMILHGVEAPNIVHTNTLAENLADIQEKDRYDVVLANPPFGGKERAEVQQNFPIKTGETASLFLQHFIKINKRTNMSKENKLQLFQNQSVRTHWDEDQGKWFFSVQDIVQILSESNDVKQYIKRMRSRNAELNANWGTICTPLEMTAADGKLRKIQAADTEGILRIIQSVPSPKAEPFKLSKEKQPKGLEENKDIARKGGNAAKKARLEIEKQTGKSIVTAKNAKKLLDKPNSKNIENE